MNRTRALTALALALGVGTASGQPEGQEIPSLLRPDSARAAAARPSPGAVEWAAVAVDVAPLAAGAPRLRLELLPGFEVLAEAEEIERRKPGELTWRGRVAELPGSQVVLTLRGGWVAGAVFLADQVYEISTTAQGQVAARLDSALFPPCGGSPHREAPARLSRTDSTGVRAASDTPDQIDVLVMYTPQARDAAGGVPQIETTAQAAVDMANTAFANSDMVARFRLVHTALAARNDTGNISSDLGWLRTNAGVAALRETYAADMVSLIVNNGGSACGVGYLLGNEDASAFGPWAFQVTARGCAVGNLTYAHEHGHNMGLSHDPANAGSPGSLYQPDGYGHFHNGSYRTVMSYNTECASGCTRHPYFSNPAVTFMGLATGILDERDNHRVANLTAPFVAVWRASVVIFADGFESGDLSGWTTTVQ